MTPDCGRAPPDAPKRGEWVTLSLADGRTMTCRFVWRGTDRMNGVRRWCVDHGAYGVHRDDWYICEAGITSIGPAERPELLLSFRDPHGKRVYVGRYTTHEAAERALDPQRSFAADVRIEAAP